MRLPIVFVSSALILAGLNVAYPVINDLTTRSGDSDPVAGFSAQAMRSVKAKYESYTRGPNEQEKPKIPKTTVQPEPVEINILQQAKQAVTAKYESFTRGPKEPEKPKIPKKTVQPEPVVPRA